jgi:anti-sigma B factor antagonist
MNQQSDATGQDAPGPSPSDCVVTEQWIDDRTVVVSASGDIDMLTAPTLEEAIRAAAGKGPAALVVDFSAVEFLASAGMGVLVAMHDELAGNVDFCVVAEGPATSRPLRLVGIADIVKVYATLDDALSALHA